MAIMGFGGGAMLGTPLTQWLLEFYRASPECSDKGDALGTVDRV